MLDCKECSFSVSEDESILHADNFDGQLALFKVLFLNDCYGLLKLKCLKIQLKTSLMKRR